MVEPRVFGGRQRVVMAGDQRVVGPGDQDKIRVGAA